MDTFRRVSPERIARAVARVIEHTLDNDIEGAEILSRDRIGQVSVEAQHPLAEQLKGRFTWLGTDEPAEGADTVQALAEWYEAVSK